MAAEPDHGRSEKVRPGATYNRDWQTDPARVAAARAWMVQRTDELEAVHCHLMDIEDIISGWEMSNQSRQVLGLYYALVVEKIRDAHSDMGSWLKHHRELLNGDDDTCIRNMAMFKVGWTDDPVG